MTGKALDELQRINLRQRRAYGLAHEIMAKVMKASPHLHYHASGAEQCAVHDAILETLMGVGAEIVTDHDRSEAGLPPRGADGWTVEELIALERRRIEALYAPWPVGGFATKQIDPNALASGGDGSGPKNASDF